MKSALATQRGSCEATRTDRPGVGDGAYNNAMARNRPVDRYMDVDRSLPIASPRRYGELNLRCDRLHWCADRWAIFPGFGYGELGGMFLMVTRIDPNVNTTWSANDVL